MSKRDLLKYKHNVDTKTASENLKRLQALLLEQKILLTERRIKEYYDYFDGQVYVSFSGKDSTVLLHIVRKLYPEVPAVFVDTGLEYPEIRNFVKTIDNVTWLKPKMLFTEVIKKYGYPVVSKKVAKMLRMIRENPESKSAKLYLSGITSTGKKAPSWKLPKKWYFLLDAPFLTSEKCCHILKQEPLDRYKKETKRMGITGTMASDSDLREKDYLKNGCNLFSKGSSRPLSFWTDNDVWDYIRSRDIPYSNIYDMGEKRTGCMFCLFGCAFGFERFDRMKITHPKQYNYCMNKLGLREVIDYIENKGQLT